MSFQNIIGIHPIVPFYISVWTKEVDRPTNQHTDWEFDRLEDSVVIPKAKFLACLKRSSILWKDCMHEIWFLAHLSNADACQPSFGPPAEGWSLAPLDSLGDFVQMNAPVSGTFKKLAGFCPLFSFHLKTYWITELSNCEFECLCTCWSRPWPATLASSCSPSPSSSPAPNRLTCLRKEGHQRQHHLAW